MTNNTLYDLVIIGASAAGISAAIYAARRGLNFVVVSQNIGGEVALSGEIENWPGTIHTDGVQLAKDFHEHIKSYNVRIDNETEVTDIRQENNYHLVIAKDGRGQEKIYKAKTVIIASGIHPRELAVSGEKELKGMGVTYCTVCDGPLYRNKITATIGSGNSALESALMMGGIAKKVYLLSKYPKADTKTNGFPRGETILVQKVKELANVEIIYNADTTAIRGQGKVEGLTYKDTASGEMKEVSIDGAMVHIGMIPNTNFVHCAKKNPLGEIEIDIVGKTDCPGVFAAGDATNVPFKQIVIAAGQGVTAALSAIDYINRWQAE